MASVNSFDFNSTHMISGSSDLTVKYWQLDNGKCLQSFNAHTDEITKVKFLPNNKVLSLILFIFIEILTYKFVIDCLCFL